MKPPFRHFAKAHSEKSSGFFEKQRYMFWCAVGLVAVFGFVGLLSCQSTGAEDPAKGQDLSIDIKVSRASLWPDSATWSVGKESGLAQLGPGSASDANAFKVTVHRDQQLGSDLLNVMLWKAGMLTAKASYQMQNDVLTRVSADRDTMASMILDTLVALNTAKPNVYPLSKDSSIAKVMAKLVVDGDSLFTNWKVKFPAGIDTSRMRREALIYAATKGQSLSVLSATWCLGMDTALAKVAMKALIPQYIPAADTEFLFPLPPVCAVVPVSLSGDLYSDSVSVSVKGRFAAKTRLIGPSVRVLKDGVEDKVHFTVEQRAQPGLTTMLWDLDLEGGVKLKAVGNPEPGTYTLVVSMEDGTNSDESRTNFKVLQGTAPPAQTLPIWDSSQFDQAAWE